MNLCCVFKKFGGLEWEMWVLFEMMIKNDDVWLEKNLEVAFNYLFIYYYYYYFCLRYGKWQEHIKVED